MPTLSEVMKGIDIESSEEVRKHRGTGVTKRPDKEVKLQSVNLEDFEPKKTQQDPTPDLVFLPRKFTPEAIERDEGFLVYCSSMGSVWWAPTIECLNANFIYRYDLEITPVTDLDLARERYEQITENWKPGQIPRLTCYILDNPADETYEVYYDTAYPSLKYGMATPNGMFIHKYPNRFHRDMAILELDKLYADSSEKAAKRLQGRKFGQDEAVIISDGCWMREVCSSSYWYIDNSSMLQMTEGHLPSEPTQAVLISEILGAVNALKMCIQRGKKTITYYYDNTSILNVFKNRKTEYIEEIKEYKDLCEDMLRNGYVVSFVELHPKTGEDRQDENKALMYFHNLCDANCRSMSKIYNRNYADYVRMEKKEGITYEKVKAQNKPKGRPGQSSGGKYQNNSKNGNNRYGRRF